MSFFILLVVVIFILRLSFSWKQTIGALCLLFGFCTLMVGLFGTSSSYDYSEPELISPCGMPYCNP